MNAIDPAARLAALIRAQVAGLRSAAGERGLPKSAGEIQGGGAREFDASASALQCIRNIAPDDQDRARKAFRLFLESVLVSEFGAQLMDDPHMAAMVDHVQRQFDSDPQLAAARDQAAQALLRAADG